METILLKELQPLLPVRLRMAISDVLSEEDDNKADELVILCEVILNELAAIGFAVYLRQEQQKDSYNDFLIELFTAKSHAYNAGPLFRWAANMIKSLDSPEAEKIKPIFWEKTGLLREKTNALSTLRNKVMHGFFVLPPEVNRKETENIAEVLQEMLDLNLFNIFDSADFHFLAKTSEGVSFKGDWSIDEGGWQLLEKAHKFGKIANKIRFQLSDEFDIMQLENVEKVSSADISLDEIEILFQGKQKGAFALWQSPCIKEDKYFAALVKQLKINSEYCTIFYQLEEDGISFTKDFLLQKIVNVVKVDHQIKDLSKDPYKAILQLIKKDQRQAVVVLNRIETALFNKNHLIHLIDFFYENNILLIAFGVHHPWMNQFFNHTHYLDYKVENIASHWEKTLLNYLRYKGPNKEIEDQVEDYNKLYEIGEKIISELKSGKTVVARRFADDNGYSMESVHELFAVLHPYCQTDSIPFEEDVIDELYGFPIELKESSGIFLSLGRRDIKLEYRHKTLSL
jgi:hypothetical protein